MKYIKDEKESYWKVEIEDFYDLIIAIIFFITVSFMIGYGTCDKRVDTLLKYYDASEALLDTLESDYNWVDAYDPMNYYESRTEVIKMLE